MERIKLYEDHLNKCKKALDMLNYKQYDRSTISNFTQQYFSAKRKYESALQGVYYDISEVTDPEGNIL